MEQAMLAEARAEADAELAGGAGPAIMVTASPKLASGHRRPARLAAQGSCPPPGLRHRLQRKRRRHRFGPLGGRLRPRTAGARGRGRGTDRQGRRPCHGGRHHRRAGKARRVARLLRGAGGSRRVPPAGRGNACRSTPRSRPRARRSTCSIRWRRPGPSAPAMSRRSSSCRATGCSDAQACRHQSHPRRTAVGQRRPHPGDRLSRRRHRAGRVPVQEPRPTVHVAGTLSGNYWNGNRRVQFRIIDAALAP